MNINGYFIFNGVDTRTLGVTVARGKPGNILRRPEREYQVDQPPGRLGDIIQDNRHFPNVDVNYYVMIPDNFDSVYMQLRNMLLSVTGYARLEDAWNTDEFYQAYVKTPLQPRVSANRELGVLMVTFSRRPERWKKSGETPITSTASVVFSGDVPNKYVFYPKITIACKTTISTNVYASGMKVLRWCVQTPQVEVGSITLYKPETKNVDDTNVTVYWSDYFVSGDNLVFDFDAGTLTNTTQGKDLSDLLPSNFTEGILSPGEYLDGGTGLIIYPLPTTYFRGIDFTPRWYAI